MLQAKNITTIVFDLDDTLRFNDPHAHSFFCDYAESLSQPLNLEQRRASQRWEHSYWATSDDLVADLKAFGEGSEVFWLNYSQRHLQALEFNAEKAQQLAPQVHAIGLDTYLDFFLTGNQLGAYKPHKEIFGNLLKFLKIPASEMDYVGDNYYADVIGARNAGVELVLLNWNSLYSNADCVEIKSSPELLTLLQPEVIS